jgi:hypothetical protein
MKRDSSVGGGCPRSVVETIDLIGGHRAAGINYIVLQFD